MDVPDPGPTQYVIDQMLPVASYLAEAGRPKLGKTTLLFLMVAAIAEGIPFAGLKTTKTRVLAFFLEDDVGEVGKKLRLCGLKTPEAVLLPEVEGTSPDWDTMFELAAKKGAGVLIVDPQVVITRTQSGRYDYEDVYGPIHHIRCLTKKYGISVISLTHSSKGREVLRDISDVIDSPIGSTAYAAGPDGVCGFGKHPDDGRLRRFLGQGRRGISFNFAFRFDSDKGIYVPVDSRDVMSELAKEIHEILSAEGKPWVQTRLAEEVGRNGADVRSALYKLKEKGLATSRLDKGKTYWMDCSKPIEVISLSGRSPLEVGGE